MPNGDQHDSVWRAIDALRDGQADLKADNAVNKRDYLELRTDINHVGQKVTGSEDRVKRYVDDAVGGLSKRIDSGVTWIKWVLGIAVPLVAALAGALISKAS